jgi:putative ABC transport system permease protein
MRLALAGRIAAAELRGGLRGFRLFLLCLAVGVAAIAASGSVSAAFRTGLEREQRAILGGDLMLSLQQRTPSAEQRALLDRYGDLSESRATRTMASRAEAPDAVRRLVEVRGVDKAHPLEGVVVLRPALPLAEAFAQRDGVWGAAAEPALLQALGVRVGDRVALPFGVVEIRAEIISEPDALGRGFAFAPRLLTALDAFAPLNLGQPGSLYTSALRLKLAPGQSLPAAKAAFEKAFPEDGTALRDRARSADGLETLLERLELFLSCVGFAALLAGGLGVRGAVAGYLEGRRGSIAVLKTLGASAGDIRLAYGLQIAALASLGALIGVALGAATPFLIAQVFGAALPIPIALSVYPQPLWAAAAAGLLAAAAFALWPLGAARATAPTELFRGGLGLGRTPWLEQAAGVAALLALAGVFALTSPDPVFAAALCGGALAAFVAFYGLGKAAQRVAGALAHRASGSMRLALSGVGGPGSLAPAALPALGLGLALLAGLGQVQSNLVTQVRDTAPARAPSILFTEIPADRAIAFDQTVERALGGPADPEDYARAPILTVRVSAINGAPIDPARVTPSERWVVENEIGATYLGAPPANANLTAGGWWPEGYAGPLLVSLEEDAARGIGVGIGDRVTFQVLGAPMEAEVTSLRTVDWSGFGANFAAIFSPGPLDAAAARNYAIGRFTPEQEEAITRALAAEFATVGVVRVRDALAAAGDLFESLALAVQAVAAVALLAGAAAVAGALASGARRRLYDAAILKTLGATRGQILTAFGLEQALAGLAAAVLGAGLGLAAAYGAVVQALEADWRLDLALAATITGGCLAAFTLAGLAAGWAALGQSPARVLAARE